MLIFSNVTFIIVIKQQVTYNRTYYINVTTSGIILIYTI